MSIPLITEHYGIRWLSEAFSYTVFGVGSVILVVPSMTGQCKFFNFNIAAVKKIMFTIFLSIIEIINVEFILFSFLKVYFELFLIKTLLSVVIMK